MVGAEINYSFIEKNLSGSSLHCSKVKVLPPIPSDHCNLTAIR